MSDFNTEMNFILKEIQGSTGFSLDRNRDYDGQPHTDAGIRGKTEVKGLTMRDISDCIVLGFMDSASFMNLETKNPIHDDIYKIDLDKIDPGAVIQNAICHVEKYMGIYPNVPKLEEL